VLVEGMVGGHERDGRSWKAEWVALPEICQLTAAALRIARTLLDGLEVRPDAMAANVARFGGLASEQVLAGLSTKLGKHRAQEVLHEIARVAGGDPAVDVVERGYATAAEVATWCAAPAVEGAMTMVDGVLARAVAARAVERESWP
jgi:adenylosuccinate lyase